MTRSKNTAFLSTSISAAVVAAAIVLAFPSTAGASPGPIMISSLFTPVSTSGSVSGGTPACATAICDIPAELAKLRADSQADRFREITGLRATYKKATDSATLHNLLDFADQAKALFQDLQEADWLIRETRSLADDCLLKLAESNLFDPQLPSYYNRLSGEGPRFEIITYWESRIPSYEDQTSLLALGSLFRSIEQVSVQSQDPDYLAREARRSQDLVTQRIVELYPGFEGVYQISVSCSGTGTSNPACGALPADRLVIMNSLSSDGIVVTLVNHDAGVIDYQFDNATITDSGSTIEAIGQPTGTVSKLHLEISGAPGTAGSQNDRNKTIRGWIQSGDSLSSLQIQGRLLASPGSVFSAQEKQSTHAPIPISLVSHLYRGQLDNSPFTLLIRPLDENSENDVNAGGEAPIGASITFDSMPSDPLRFQTVRYFPRRGILVLLAGVNNGGYLKFVITFQAGTSEITGMAFGSLDGGIHSLQAAPVIPPTP